MWITTGPAFAGSIVTSMSMGGCVERISVENGTASAPRAGCELTSIAVVTNTAIPKSNSPATDQRRFRTSGSAGTVRPDGGDAVSVATAALSVAGRRARTMRRLHAASASNPMKNAIFTTRRRPNVVSKNASRDQPT